MKRLHIWSFLFGMAVTLIVGFSYAVALDWPDKTTVVYVDRPRVTEKYVEIPVITGKFNYDIWHPTEPATYNEVYYYLRNSRDGHQLWAERLEAGDPNYWISPYNGGLVDGQAKLQREMVWHYDRILTWMENLKALVIDVDESTHVSENETGASR